MSTTVLAHGVGGRQDLPIPFAVAVAGAAVAVAISFIAMAVLWRISRLRGETAGWPIPARAQAVAEHPVTRGILRLVGLVATGFVVVAAVVRTEHREQPDGRVRLRAVLGGAGAGVAVVRPGVEAAQPAAHHPPRHQHPRWHRTRPRPPRLPRAARVLARHGRAVRVRLARARRTRTHLPDRACAVVHRLRRGAAARRDGLRRRLVRPSGRVRGLLQPHRPARPTRAPHRRQAGAAQPTRRAGRPSPGVGNRSRGQSCCSGPPPTTASPKRRPGYAPCSPALLDPP